MGMPPQYHHGNLRAALIATGLRLARKGGVGAVTVREVTRAAGVSPSAAYRHFEDHRGLVVAVALAAQDLLADAIKTSIAAHTQDADPLPADAGTADVGTADAATAALRGVGNGYISFALSEPGWFELALLTFDPAQAQATVRVANQVPLPFKLLLEALDGMVEAGALTPEEREHAEWPCWSAVHGFADIATRGPLQGAPPEMLHELGAHVVDRAIAGLKHR